MSAATTTLPAGWATILDEVHRRLDHAIALADTRIAQAPQPDTKSLGHECRQEIAKWNDRLARLNAYLESAEQVVQSFDETLIKEETLLRHDLAKCTAARQKLAASTACAIR
jgi:hypothetical protein